MKNNQTGFSAVVVLVLIAVIAIIGFCSWVILGKSKGGESSTPQAITKQKTTSVKSKPNTAEGKINYLVIEEWGVKYPLDPSIADATYVMEKSGNQYVFVQTPRLVKLAGESKHCAGADESISLNRAKVGDDRFGSPWTEEELQNIGTKVGDFYYFGEGGQACFGSDAELKQEAAIVDEVSAIRSKLGQLAQSVQSQ
jgi:hypothetical protein